MYCRLREIEASLEKDVNFPPDGGHLPKEINTAVDFLIQPIFSQRFFFYAAFILVRDGAIADVIIWMRRVRGLVCAL